MRSAEWSHWNEAGDICIKIYLIPSRMIECSVFGYLEEVDCICNHLRLYKRTDRTVNESIYSNGLNTLLVSEESDGVYLVSRGAPDRNKNRMSLCSKVQRSRIRTLDTLGMFLSSLGFELVRRGTVTSTVFEKGPAHVEISRYAPEESGCREDKKTGGYHLVKVFATAENAYDGEKILSKMIEELEDQVQLLRPSIK
uniref:Mediator of RNA polymerase II transcription subunit 18 n=1 Tax=Encephalitozoon cuniculi TaxID=6035 RepID=M1K9N6_ENCCN|nr:hypothetical protein ECU07_0720 [Encephalitozoon cuniculi]